MKSNPHTGASVVIVIQSRNRIRLALNWCSHYNSLKSQTYLTDLSLLIERPAIRHIEYDEICKTSQASFIFEYTEFKEKNNIFSISVLIFIIICCWKPLEIRIRWKRVKKNKQFFTHFPLLTPTHHPWMFVINAACLTFTTCSARLYMYIVTRL